ncbi:MAG: nucleotidyl transferase AbiEii/AbiGii toxin family protein [Terriglobales bacterium]
MRGLLDGRTFETFHLDLGQGDPLSGKPEKLAGSTLLEFAGIPPPTILCYPLTTQIAEKLHAYTRPYAAGESSRVRDLVDVLLIASLSRVKGPGLLEALRATFVARGTPDLPSVLLKYPADWSGPYKRFARELALRWSTVAEAWQAAGQFLNPVLQGKAKGSWHPQSWTWR